MDAIEVPGVQLDFFTDVSSLVGWGCYFSGRWMQGRWPRGFVMNHQVTIAWLELYALTLAITTWAELLTKRRFIVNCDNTMAVTAVNKQTSKCPKTMALVRILVYTQLKYDFRVKAQYVKSDENNNADALSYFQEDRFQREVPWANTKPSNPLRSLCPPSSSIWTSCWF